MHQFTPKLRGRLLDPVDGETVARAFTASKGRTADSTALVDLRELDAVVPGEDPDAGVVRLALAQLATAYFETTEDPNDSEAALEAARSLTEFATLPAWLSSYERGRTVYQVAKRLGDPSLLEEAVHFYDEAMRDLSVRSRLWWTLRRYRREAAVMRRNVAEEAWAGAREQGAAAAHFDIPLEAFPAAANCRRPAGLRGRLTTFPEPFYCQPLGLRSQAMFWFTGRVPTLRRRVRELDAHGRRTSGFMNLLEQDPSPLVNQMSLTVWLGHDDADLAVADMSHQAAELYEWAERVSRWADVVTGRLPKLGLLVVTRYLYGDLLTNSGSRRLVLNADEPGITRELLIRRGVDMSRYELSYVLNRLVLHEVPIAIEMLQMAQHSLLEDKPRQAVVEAGTAAEAALSVLYDSYPTTKPREAPHQRPWTLGRLVVEAHHAGVLPAGDTQATLSSDLVVLTTDVRNGAASGCG